MSGDQSVGFGFERLEVWRKAVEFASLVYTITKGFPREELFGLTMQLRRAAVSVAANIAEGASRSSGRDRARFFEIVTMLHIAYGQRLVTDDQLANTRSDVSDMCRMLSGLKRSALSADGCMTRKVESTQP